MLSDIKFWLSDFVPYSVESLIGLHGYYNQVYWPYNCIVILLIPGLLWSVYRQADRPALFVIGLCWIWSGLVFLQQHYVTLNWSASYLKWLFVVQACLLFFHTIKAQPVITQQPRRFRILAALTLLFATLIYAVLQFSYGHNLTELGWPGLVPDATAITTIACIVTLPRSKLLLLIIPVCWCSISFVGSWPLNYIPGMTVLPIALGLVVTVNCYTRVFNRRPSLQ